MIDKTVIRRAAARANRTGELPKLYFWFYKRIFSTALLALLAVNLLYTYFFMPNGLAGLTPNLIISRWDHPTWGLLWRLFDWLLVGLGVAWATELSTTWAVSAGKSMRFQKLLKGLIFFVGGVVIAVSTQVIFGPRA